MLNVHNLNLADLCSKEESRFTLNSILVDKDCTVETDGHQLVRVTLPKYDADSYPQFPGFKAIGTWERFLLPAKDAKDIAKALPKTSTIPILANAAIGKATEQADKDGKKQYAVLGVTDLERAKTFTIRRPTGNFPDYERVILNVRDATFRIGLNAGLLKRLLTFAEKFDGGRVPAIRFFFFAQDKAVVMKAEGGENQEMTAVLMPASASFGANELAPEAWEIPQRVYLAQRIEQLKALGLELTPEQEETLKEAHRAAVANAIQDKEPVTLGVAEPYPDLKKIVEKKLRGETPKRLKLNDHCTRYYLMNGWFVEREETVNLRHNGYRYTIWIPGDSEAHKAASFIGGSDTLRGALQLVYAPEIAVKCQHCGLDRSDIQHADRVCCEVTIPEAYEIEVIQYAGEPVEIPAPVPIDQRPAPATDDKTQRRKQAARKAWETIRAKRATAGKAA